MKKRSPSKNQVGARLMDRLRRASWVIEEFLEDEIQYESLESDLSKSTELRDGLRTNLGHYTASLPPVNDLFVGVGRKGELNKITSESSRKVAKHICRCHSLLNQFWNQFKSSLTEFKKLNNLYGDFPLESGQVKIIDGTSSHGKTRYFRLFMPYPIDIELYDKNIRKQIVPEDLLNNEPDIALRVSFFTGTVSFDRDEFELIRSFMILLEGLPIDKMCECSARDCNRWYVKTDGTMKKKQYCSNRCVSREKGKKRREEPGGREEYNKYHREYQRALYRKKVLGG